VEIRRHDDSSGATLGVARGGTPSGTTVLNRDYEIVSFAGFEPVATLAGGSAGAVEFGR
jgi:hypothetical protein